MSKPKVKEESSHRTPNDKKIQLFPVDVCIICYQQNCDLMLFQEDHFNNGKIENHMKTLLRCFSINILNPEYDIRNTKVCQTCITSMREVLSFRKVVREAQQRLYNRIDLLINNYCCSMKGIVPDKDSIKLKRKIPSKTSGKVLKPLKCSKPPKPDPNRLDETFDNDNTEYISFSSSDSESSTTSEQMKMATAYKELVIDYNFEPNKPLDKSCRTCPICEKTFETFRQIQLHHESHFIKNVCHFCGMSYAKDGAYKYHMAIHEGKMYPCTQCEKKFIHRKELCAHYKRFHNRDKIHTCPECGEKFRTQPTKMRHIYYNHPHIQVKTFPCPVCSKIFMSLHRMIMHKECVHDNLQRYSCTECDHLSKTKMAMKLHMIVHTGIKKHVCNVCGNAYARRGTLREHLKIHNNIRNYKCDICEKTFVQKCSLKSHMKTHKNSI